MLNNTDRILVIQIILVEVSIIHEYKSQVFIVGG